MVEILILLSLWLIVCAVCAAVGFFVGKNCKRQMKREPEAVTAGDVNRAKKSAREYENFLAYDGSEQQ